MKIMPLMQRTTSCRIRILLLVCSLFLLITARPVQATLPFPGDPPPYDWLDFWSFDNTNSWLTFSNKTPVSYTNLDVSLLGNGHALLLDNTNGAWLQYNVLETNGMTNLTVKEGTVMMWFAPTWSGTNQGGTGPGDWGRLIEVGSYTTNASYGWWSLYLDAAGVNLYFSSQTNNGNGQTHLSAPIAWTTNRWHLIVLTYSSTNSALYLDGELVTNGLPVTYLPGTNTFTNGFFIGSDNTGGVQARGMFDDISTYNHQLSASNIANSFTAGTFSYYMNPLNFANWSSAPSAPSYDPVFMAITGAGYVQSAGSAASCVTNANVWATNMTATLVGSTPTNQSVTFTFEIAGGSNNLVYDVFATGGFTGTSITNSPWLWMGQGSHCNLYTITNLPPRAFVILGTPLDSDGDGLTDAYERLVSHTDPANADTDGDGIIDGWEVLQGMNPLVNESAQSSGRLNYIYDPAGWLQTITGKRNESITPDNEGNLLQVQP